MYTRTGLIRAKTARSELSFGLGRPLAIADLRGEFRAAQHISGAECQNKLGRHVGRDEFGVQPPVSRGPLMLFDPHGKSPLRKVPPLHCVTSESP